MSATAIEIQKSWQLNAILEKDRLVSIKQNHTKTIWFCFGYQTHPIKVGPLSGQVRAPKVKDSRSPKNQQFRRI